MSDPVQEAREAVRQFVADYAPDGSLAPFTQRLYGLISAGQQEERDMVAALIEAAAEYASADAACRVSHDGSVDALGMMTRLTDHRGEALRRLVAAALREVKP